MSQLDLKFVLQGRLHFLEEIAKHGVVPGELDSIELEQLIGRIKELHLILRLLSARSIAEGIKELKNHELSFRPLDKCSGTTTS